VAGVFAKIARAQGVAAEISAGPQRVNTERDITVHMSCWGLHIPTSHTMQSCAPLQSLKELEPVMDNAMVQFTSLDDIVMRRKIVSVTNDITATTLRQFPMPRETKHATFTRTSQNYIKSQFIRPTSKKSQTKPKFAHD
jgi:hypothetical protein